MLKEVLQYVVSAFTAETKEIGSQQFSTQPLQLIKEPNPSPLNVRNLSGLIAYIKFNYDELPPVLIQVDSPTEVNVYSRYNRDMHRKHYMQATALLPGIPFEKFISAEAFNILLQSCFVPNEFSSDLLAVVGNIQEENVTNIGDDGISQSVIAKTGIATLAPVKVPNPVFLKPFRTFVDIEQPESQFIFRMKEGPAAGLFEADGGAWKLRAIHTIRDHLSEQLAELVVSEHVTIIA